MDLDEWCAELIRIEYDELYDEFGGKRVKFPRCKCGHAAAFHINFEKCDLVSVCHPDGCECKEYTIRGQN